VTWLLDPRLAGCRRIFLREVLLDAWWVSTFPGLAIVVTVVGYNLLGDGLRDALDVRASKD